MAHPAPELDHPGELGPRLGERLPLLPCEEASKLFLALLEEPGGPNEDLAPTNRRQRPPGREGVGRRRDGRFGILLRGKGYPCEDVIRVGRVDVVDRLVRRGGDPAPADEVLEYARVDAQDGPPSL
jgi:hypothetical protein